MANSTTRGATPGVPREVSDVPRSNLLKQDLNVSYPIVTRGAGVYLYDSDGRQYLDGSSGAMTANIGHGVSEIAQAMKHQAKTVAFVYRAQFTSAPAEQLAAKLASLAPPPLNSVFFVNSGSEASEHAMRVVLQYWRELGRPDKTKLLGRQLSYHGMSMGALSMSGHPMRRQDYGPLLHDFAQVSPSYCYRCPFGLTPKNCNMECADAWAWAIEAEGAETVAAVIAEPIVGAAGGALTPPAGYFRRLREICDRYDILLIADEVITGLGRTGAWFASAAQGVAADIITTGKGTSAGYTPMAALILHDRIAEVFRQGSGTAPFGHTFSGNPLSAAICLAVLNYIEDHDLLSNVLARAAELRQGLTALAERFPIIADVRGRGLLWGFEIVRDVATGEPFDGKARVSAQLVECAMAEGLVIYPAGIPPLDNACLIAPPLTISSYEIDDLLTRLSSAVAVLARRLAD